MYKRTLASFWNNLSKDFPVLLLTGMRQVGKSTLLEMVKSANRNYVSLDNRDLRLLAKQNPDLFLQRFQPPVIIDEIQYAPELFPSIKIYVDSHKKNGLFWLTGSQKFKLMEGIEESLSGRVAIIDMLGFSYRETLKIPDSSKPFLPSVKSVFSTEIKPLKLNKMYSLIFRGNFPRQIVNKGRNRDVFYKSYLQTYIERDVKDYQGIVDDLKFYNFVRAVAVRTGNLINYADIARDVNIDERTAKAWMSALERSGVIYILQPYSNNLTKRIIKTSKVYFLDTGLCAYLASIHSPEALEASYLSGAIFESWVFAEILKSYWHNCKEPNIYFYRDTDQKEVDFIIEQDGALYPIEVKRSASPDSSDAKNFNVLEKIGKPIGDGAIICMRESYLPVTEKIVAIPAWEI